MLQKEVIDTDRKWQTTVVDAPEEDGGAYSYATVERNNGAYSYVTTVDDGATGDYDNNDSDLRGVATRAPYAYAVTKLDDQPVGKPPAEYEVMTLL